MMIQRLHLDSDNLLQKCRTVLLISMSMFVLTGLMAQEDEAPALFKSRISLSANQFPDGTIDLNALLRAKVEGAYQAIPDQPITFYGVTEDGEEVSLGEAVTGPKGVATLHAEKAKLAADADGYFSLLAKFGGNEKLTDSDGDLRIHPASLTIEPIEEDSAYSIKVVATAPTADGDMPIADAAVGVYVKRMFSSLKVGEGTTDEEGMAEIAFPSNLPGDEASNLIITAKVEESDDYGNLVATVTKSWGKPIVPQTSDLPRALWSPHPPWWMIIAFFVLMGTVWVHYFIIMYKLTRFKAMERKHPASNASQA